MLRGECGKGTERGMGEEALEKGREFPSLPPAGLFTIKKVKQGEPLLFSPPPTLPPPHPTALV